MVETAGFELALDDAEMSRELAVISSHLVEEPLGLLASDERLDRVSEGVIDAAALVADDDEAAGNRASNRSE